MPLAASVATVVVALTVLVGVADTMAERRLERHAAQPPATVPQTLADTPSASQGPAGGEERTAAMMPEAADADQAAGEDDAPQPLPPIGHMRPQPPDVAVVPIEPAGDDPAATPDAAAPGEAEQAPADPAPPAGEPAPPLDITPPDPQPPVELAETGDAQSAGDDSAPVSPQDGGDDARVAVVPPRGEAAEAPADGHIIVQEGNNLWHLARVIYGSGVYYLLIFEANRETISDPNDIHPGQTLVTPGVTPPEIVPADLREPIAGLDIDLPPDTAARLEAEHAALQRRR